MLDETKGAGVLDGATDEGIAEEVGVTVTVEQIVVVEHTWVCSAAMNLKLSRSRVPWPSNAQFQPQIL